LFQVCFPIGRELGLVKNGHGYMRGAKQRQRGANNCDDGVAYIGDSGRGGVWGGVITGAFGISARKVSRQELFQPGSAWWRGWVGDIRGCQLGTVVVMIMTGVKGGGARGMSSGEGPGLMSLWSGGTPNTAPGGVLNGDFCLISVIGAPSNGCKVTVDDPACEPLIREVQLPSPMSGSPRGVSPCKYLECAQRSGWLFCDQ